MWTFECSEETTASRAEVWALWSDPSRWSEFDPGIVWARLEGPFVAGATVKLKPKGGPRASLRIETAEPDQGFSTLARLPFTKLRFRHELSDTPEGARRITSHIQVTGLLGGVVPRFFRLADNEVLLLGNLARLAAGQSAAAAVDGT